MSFQVRDLCVSYGRIRAVQNVDLEVGPGQAVAVLGPNGAGKSSLLRAISGLEKTERGTIVLAGRDLGPLAAHERVAAGVVHVPEGRRVFSTLTVEENLEMGGYLYHGDRRESRRVLESLLERFPQLAGMKDKLGGLLSGGEQQMLALARGLMSRPTLLMLDEPSLGLSPVAVQRFYALLQEQMVQRPEMMVVLVEQSAAVALRTASTVVVLSGGRVVASGDSKQFADRETLSKFYLSGTPRGDESGKR